MQIGAKSLARNIEIKARVRDVERLSEVDGLGHFVELEVVLRADQSNQEGEKIAYELMQKLGILEIDLLAGAYVDMLKA